MKKTLLIVILFSLLMNVSLLRATPHEKETPLFQFSLKSLVIIAPLVTCVSVWSYQVAGDYSDNLRLEHQGQYQVDSHVEQRIFRIAELHRTQIYSAISKIIRRVDKDPAIHRLLDDLDRSKNTTDKFKALLRADNIQHLPALDFEANSPGFDAQLQAYYQLALPEQEIDILAVVAMDLHFSKNKNYEKTIELIHYQRIGSLPELNYDISDSEEKRLAAISAMITLDPERAIPFLVRITKNLDWRSKEFGAANIELARFRHGRLESLGYLATDPFEKRLRVLDSLIAKDLREEEMRFFENAARDARDFSPEEFKLIGTIVALKTIRNLDDIAPGFTKMNLLLEAPT